MQRVRLLTSGESHGPALTLILGGLPAGIALDKEFLNAELAKRRKLHGRSARMKLESDEFTCEGGLRGGVTTGNPLCFRIPNAEASEWEDLLSPWGEDKGERVDVPRPGHADLASALKFASTGDGRLHPADIRNVMERASARETAARVLAGAISKQMLAQVGVNFASFVYCIGKASLPKKQLLKLLNAAHPGESAFKCADASLLRIPEPVLEKAAVAAIADAKERGTTLGGGFATMAFGILPGLGSYSQWDERLDGMLAQAVISIPSVKAVGFGCAQWLEGVDGSSYHDEIVRSGDGVAHASNNAGGITGGITNGMPVVITAAVKPIPTQKPGLPSIDLSVGKTAAAPWSRNDVTIVPAAALIAESMLALVIADAALCEFGGSHVSDFIARWEERKQRISHLF